MHLENVVSLFDGMSCLQQALNRQKITYGTYYASEVDKHAIKVTQHNYPNTIQLGSVVDVDVSKLPKIDLIAGGSPCQSFSFAGKRKGMATKCETEILTLEDYLKLKKDGFEFEGQSYLFWEYMRILTEIRKVNPNVKFLLENVVMDKKWESVLTQAIGVHPILINSSRVSAQNRKRLYWTNIGLEPNGLFGDLHSIIKQPKDKGILLKHILQKEVDKKYFLKNDFIEKLLDYNQRQKDNNNGFSAKFRDTDKIKKMSALKVGGGMKDDLIIDSFVKIDKNGKAKTNQDKASCFTAGGNSGGNPSDMDLLCFAVRGRENPAALTPKRTEYGKAIRKEYEKGEIEEQRKNIQQLEPRTDGKTNCLTSVQKDNYIMFNPNDRRIITHEILGEVSVRKYEVDIPALQKCLKEHKKMTIKQISEKLNVPKTMVEHWFRTDNGFSIPDKDIWFKLKDLLEIKTDEFDESITEFITKPNEYEKTNRVYDEEGLSPTLTSSNSDEKILIRNCNDRTIKQLNPSKESGGKQPFQQNRIYDADGIAPALNAQLSTRSNFIIEKSPCLHGFEHGTNGQFNKSLANGGMIRRLTPIECCRLQTVADDYFFDKDGNQIVSDTQIYKMCGNGWTVDVPAHILSYL